jgi:hypothetical protein
MQEVVFGLKGLGAGMEVFEVGWVEEVLQEVYVDHLRNLK